MTRYRSRFETPTERWERAGESPNYRPRHGADWQSVEARAITDRARAHEVLDAAHVGSARDWLRISALRAAITFSVGSVA